MHLKQTHILLAFLTLAALVWPAALQAVVVRSISGTACQPVVSATISPEAATSAWVYEESVRGLTPTAISDNGVALSYPGVIRWGINFSANETVYSYTLTGPDGTYTIYGSESQDGVDTETIETTVTIDCTSVNPPLDQVAAPIFDPPTGTDAPVSVTISTATADASIYYTTDGTVPNASSTLYVSPVAINESAMLQAVAIKAGMQDSAVARGLYSTPSAIPTQTFDRSIAGTACRPVVSINVIPETGTSAYVVEESLYPGLVPENISDGGIWVAESATIRWAIFLDDAARTLTYELTGPDADYVLSGSGSFDGRDQALSGPAQVVIDCIPDQVAAPVITPATSTRVPVTASMTTDTTGAEIRYTTDGTDPVETSTLYSAPIPIDSAITIRAKSFATGLLPSETTQADYLPAVRPKAIILAGGGPYTGNSLWPATSYVSAFAYKALMYQGYGKDDIQFLSHDLTLDVDGNGELDDIDALATRANLEHAITSWAADGEEVLIFLTDHGGDKTFLIDEEDVLSAADLAAWLDTLQNTMPGRLTVIYDACQSGTFIFELIAPAGKQRVVITSASNEPAVFLSGGVLSFSYQFWSYIFYTGNLYDAFLHGSGLVFNDQRALLDVNGNGIANEKEDRIAAGDITIGRGMVAASAPPHINTYAGEQIIENGTSATVWVSDITSLDPIARVWAVIMPPDYHPGNADIPITALPTLELVDADSDGTYEGTYDSFTLNGTYRLVIYAKDDQGIISSPRKVKVAQTGGEIQANTIPTANDMNFATDEDTHYQGTLGANDADDDPLNFIVVTDGTIGTVTITDANAGTFIYYPHTNENGADTFTFKVNDGRIDSETATVTITVNPVEDVPTAVDLSFDMVRNTTLSDTLSGSDGDDDSLSYAIDGQPTHGVVNLLNTATGAFIYLPTTGYYGTDTFTYTADDGKGTSLPGAVIINIDRGFNSAPIATSTATSGDEDTEITGTLLGSDPDGDTVTFTLTTTPAYGTVTLTDENIGTLIYTPPDDFNGTDIFTFKVNDGLLDSTIADCAVTVTPVNDPPVAQNGNLSVQSIAGSSGELLAKDVENDAFTYAVAENGQMGVAVITDPATGAFTYTPDTSENGIDTFTFTADDGQAVSSPAKVSVSILMEQAVVNRALSGDGCTTDVSLTVTPVSTVSSYVMEEALPVGVTPTNINEGGAWDSANRTIKWGLFLDNLERTFSYSITGDDGVYDIIGGGSFDGWDQVVVADSVAINCGDLRVAAPVLTPLSGSRVPVDVVMSSDTDGAEIRYTTDGSQPTQEAILYAAPVHFAEPVTIKVRAYKSGMYDSHLSEARYLPPAGHKAVVVTGGGPYAGNSLWGATQLVGEYAYKALLYQGYTKEDVLLLSAVLDVDVDGNGLLDDVDGLSTSANLQDAILNWARDAESLLLFMTDHGGRHTFQMSPGDILSAHDLDSWLDTLQASFTGKVIVVYDACRSGSFVEVLTPPVGKDRVVITSAANRNAWFLRGGRISFSYQFWASIFSNANIFDAFSNAKQLMKNFQVAEFDADGDGITGENDDWLAVKDLSIGRGAVSAAVAPQIGFVSPPQRITTEVSATITAGGITSLNGVERVWAVIVPPDYAPASEDEPITEMTELNLLDLGNNGIYEATHDGFTSDGVYTIIVYTQDFQGLVSVPVATKVIKGNLMGDINGDGNVDLTDALLTLQVLSGMKPTSARVDIPPSYYDVDGNNKIRFSKKLQQA